MADHNTFGAVAMEARKKAGLTLREAARRLVLSPSYLSKVELDKADPPSAEVIRRMAALYAIPVSALLRHAQQRVRDVIGQDVHGNPGLLAFYRLAKDMDPDEILSLIEKLKTLLPPEDRARLEEDPTSFYRRSCGRSELFAADVRPRLLSKLDIRRRAECVLAEHGLTPETYAPPTPIERIIEDSKGIILVPSDRPGMRQERGNSPLVLGLTRWDDDDRRLIEISELLFNGDDDDRLRHRLNYTLAHEFWHAIEHLPLMSAQGRRGGMFRITYDHRLLTDPSRPGWWTRKTKRKLLTNEDWQEWQAQCFASEILMPHWSVRAAFQRRLGSVPTPVPPGCAREEWADQLAGTTFERAGVEFRPLYELYDVSRQAMAIRLCELNLVGQVATPA